MERDEKLFQKVCLPAYREMFKKATPSVNFNDLMKTGEVKQDGFFFKYHLSLKEIDKIIEKHIKKNVKKLRIRKYEQNKIRTTLLLGCSPCSSRDRWLKESKKGQHHESKD